MQHSHNLIHYITNPISMNDCVNTVLVLGAKPIMAQHPMECEQITARSKTPTLNLDNFDDSRAAAVKKSPHCTSENGISVIVDIVGAGCGDLHGALVKELLHERKFSIVKGNPSELKAVSGRDDCTLGIDMGDDGREAPAKSAEWLVEFACRCGVTVLYSGEVDILTGGEQIYFVENGDSMVTLCTGTDRMLNVIATVFLSVARTALDATLAACITSELAAEESVPIIEGSNSFYVSLFGSLYEINAPDFAKARIRREL